MCRLEQSRCKIETGPNVRSGPADYGKDDDLAYPLLANASDEALAQYAVSKSGIHWPELDADLSLRGLLMSELVKGNVTS